MGFGFAILIARKSTKQPVDHNHLFDEALKNATLFINRYSQYETQCECQIKVLREQFEDYIETKRLNYEIEELYALLRNNNSFSQTKS